MGNLINIPKVQVDATSSPKDYPRLINQLQQNIIDAFNKLQSTVSGIDSASAYMEIDGGPQDFPSTGVRGDAGKLTLGEGTWDITLVIAAASNGATITDDAFEAGLSLSSGNTLNGMQVGNNLVNFAINASNNGLYQGGSIANWRQMFSVATQIFAKVKCSYSVATPNYYYRMSAVQVA